jgi:hypothetical protein
VLGRLHSTCHNAALAAILALAASAAGCALWHKETWNLDRFRDERAVDIEHRLERNEPIVKSPF